MQPRHTPGPWIVRESTTSNYLYEVVARTPRGKESVIARLAGGPFASSRAENARLIAAAPALLAAAERVADSYRSGDMVRSMEDLLRAIFAAKNAS